MEAIDYIIEKFSREPFAGDKRLRESYNNYYFCSIILKRLSLLDLQYLGNAAGLDMKHYNTKSLIIKGLMIRLTGGCVGVDDKFVELF